jgi:hypothetical protein
MPPKRKRTSSEDVSVASSSIETTTTKRRRTQKRDNGTVIQQPPTTTTTTFTSMPYQIVYRIFSFLDTRSQTSLLLASKRVSQLQPNLLVERRLRTFRRSVPACERCSRGVFRDDPQRLSTDPVICWRCGEEKVQRVYATTAKKLFHLSAKDFEEKYPSTCVPNPHAQDTDSHLYETRHIEEACIQRYGGWWKYWAEVQRRNAVNSKRMRTRRQNASTRAAELHQRMSSALERDLQDRIQYFDETTMEERDRAVRTAGVYRNDSHLCRLFIEGRRGNEPPPPSLGQVISTMMLCRHLFDEGGPRCFHNLHEEMKTNMFQHKMLTDCSWHEALEEVIVKFDSQIERYSYT